MYNWRPIRDVVPGIGETVQLQIIDKNGKFGVTAGSLQMDPDTHKLQFSFIVPVGLDMTAIKVVAWTILSHPDENIKE